MGNIHLNNRLWIEKEGIPYLGWGRIHLLETIDAQGSISKAARAMGMSYKRAWQLVNTINNIADEPIVERSTGGAGGGGTSITPRGKKVIAEFKRIDSLCRMVLEKEEKKCCF
jgi:molybdate transport system regulatory protein